MSPTTHEPVSSACLSQGPDLAIHHSEDVLESMNEWCKEHHGKSGLTQRVRESCVSLQEAEQQVRGRLGCGSHWGEGPSVGLSVCRGWLMQRRHVSPHEPARRGAAGALDQGAVKVRTTHLQASQPSPLHNPLSGCNPPCLAF